MKRLASGVIAAIVLTFTFTQGSIFASVPLTETVRFWRALPNSVDVVVPALLSRFRVSTPAPRLQDASGVTTPVGPTITTDKTGYLAGEQVIVFGSGLTPVDVFTMQLTHADGGA